MLRNANALGLPVTFDVSSMPIMSVCGRIGTLALSGWIEEIGGYEDAKIGDSSYSTDISAEQLGYEMD